jgi:carbamoyl-phosphate synthase small subunit
MSCKVVNPLCTAFSAADASKSDEELVSMTKNWTIVGKDLLSVVSCKEPYEWKDVTEEEWEFNEGAKTAAAGKKFKVRVAVHGIRREGLI